MTELLRLTDLHAFYGESHVLHGIDLNVHTSEVVTLLGRNGSGRSTTLKAILGLVPRRTGSVSASTNRSTGPRKGRRTRRANSIGGPVMAAAAQ